MTWFVPIVGGFMLCAGFFIWFCFTGLVGLEGRVIELERRARCVHDVSLARRCGMCELPYPDRRTS